MTKPKVAVLIPSRTLDRVWNDALTSRLKDFADVDPSSHEKIDEDLASRLIRDADGAVVGWGTPKLTETVLNNAPSLKIVASSAGSVKPFVTDVLWDRKIIVTTSSPVIADYVAEFSVGLMIIGLTRAVPYSRAIREAGWMDKRTKKGMGLRGATVGIISAGFIGRRVIKLLQSFECSILLYDPFVSDADAEKMGVVKSDLTGLMAEAHVISVHAPSIPATRKMINREMLALTREDVVIINTSRGAVIDEEALIEFLQKRPDMYACIDVTDPEPPDAENPLRRMENVLLTPHIAGKGSNTHLGANAVEELRRHFAGEKPKYPVTRDMLDTIA